MYNIANCVCHVAKPITCILRTVKIIHEDSFDFSIMYPFFTIEYLVFVFPPIFSSHTVDINVHTNSYMYNQSVAHDSTHIGISVRNKKKYQVVRLTTMSQYLVVRQHLWLSAKYMILWCFIFMVICYSIFIPRELGDSRLAFTFHSWLKFPRVICQK